MLSACAIKVLWPRKGSVRKPSKTVDLKLFQHKLNIVVLMKLSLGWNVDICTASLCLLIHIYFLLPPFQKSRNASPQSTVTGSLGSFLRMTTRRPFSMKGQRLVSSARAHGHWPWQSWWGGPFVGTGRQGGICWKQTGPIKHSYFFWNGGSIYFCKW